MKSKVLEFSANQIRECRETLIVAPTLSVMRDLREALGKDSSVKQAQLIADAFSLYHSRDFSFISPVIGSSSINLAIEPFLFKGVRKVLLIGYACSLGNKVKVSEHFCARSVRNNIETKFLELNTSGLDKLGTFQMLDLCSVDSPYFENPQTVSKLRDNGVDAIEMECFSLAKLCQIYDAELLTCFTISDVWTETWKPEFGSKEVRKSMKELCIKALAALSSS